MLLLLTLQKIWCNWLLDQYSCLFFLKIFSRIFIFNLLTYLLFFLTSHRLAMIFPSLWGLFYWTNSYRSAVIFPYAFFSGLCIWYLHSKGTAYSGLLLGIFSLLLFFDVVYLYHLMTYLQSMQQDGPAWIGYIYAFSIFVGVVWLNDFLYFILLEKAGFQLLIMLVIYLLLVRVPIHILCLIMILHSA